VDDHQEHNTPPAAQPPAATPPSISAPGDEGYKSGEEEEEEEDVKERRGWQLRKRKMMHLPVA
jgi:hypothetical protein